MPLSSLLCDASVCECNSGLKADIASTESKPDYVPYELNSTREFEFSGEESVAEMPAFIGFDHLYSIEDYTRSFPSFGLLPNVLIQ